MLELHLVRHTSVDISPGICYGQTDVPLSTTFEQEAQEVVKMISDTNYRIVYSSPLSRCTRLAAYSGFNSPILDNRLMEMNFGDWEGKYWDNIGDPQLNSWFSNWIEERTTGGESFHDLCIRTALFIEEMSKYQNEKLLIFTHAGFIRAAWVTLQQITPQEAFNRKISFGERVILAV